MDGKTHKITKYRDEWLNWNNPLDKGNKQWRDANHNSAWII
jgi:hypothetical protein